MSTNMTFDSLLGDLGAYIEKARVPNTDAFNQRERIVNLSERSIITDMKLQGYEKTLRGQMQLGVPIYAKPDRWRDTVSINIGTGAGNATRKTVFTRDYEYVRSYWPNEADTGEPVFYSDYDFNHWLFAPTPDEEYPIEILYYELPPLLDDTTQSNWLTEYAPQLLLYGTLLEATPFLKNDERIGVWQSMYDRAAAMLNGEDLAKILDRSAVRKEA